MPSNHNCIIIIFIYIYMIYRYNVHEHYHIYTLDLTFLPEFFWIYLHRASSPPMPSPGGLAICQSRPNRAVTIWRSFLGRPKPMNNAWRPVTPGGRKMTGIPRFLCFFWSLMAGWCGIHVALLFNIIHSAPRTCNLIVTATFQWYVNFRIHYIWLKLRLAFKKS